MQAHAMTPFQGAGAGQAIEVSVCISWVYCERNVRYGLGCFDIGFAALKRARNKDHGGPRT